jgi:hypothetical protein
VGFTDVEYSNFYEAPLLMASDLGFFIADPIILDFVAIGSPIKVYHSNVAIGPRGALVADVAQNQVDFYRATDPTDSPGAPRASAPGCSNLLAWARRENRLACLDSETRSVRIFDLSEQNGTITVDSTALGDSDVYADSLWETFPRLMSASGDWMVLTTSNETHLADLRPASPEVLWSTTFPVDAAAAELKFSPDERFLMLHRGTEVRLYETSTGVQANVLDMGVGPEACQESQLAQPDWCGSARDLTQPVWSGDSQLLGVVRDDGGLVVLDLRSPPPLAVIYVVPISPNCGAGCVGTARFQP